jgi:tetratricopeptide (TPR) repeat protein
VSVHKFYILLVCISLFCCTSKEYKIPITTTSKEALAEYQKGIQFTDVLKIDEAEVAFKKAIALDSTFAMAYLELALLRDDYDIRKNLIAKAMSYLDNLSEGEQLLILGKNKFYGNDEGEPEFYYFEKLARLYPEDDIANFQFGYINVHHGQHFPDSAIHYYKKALEINPKVSKYYERLTEAYLLNQDFDNAEKNINTHINFLPDHVTPRITYGEMLLTEHRYEESFEAYKKVLELNPKAAWAMIGSATNLNFLNRFKEARNYIRMLDFIPLSDYEYRHKWRVKTCSYLVEGKIDSAIVVLKQQKKESESGVNKRETVFHQYYPLLRMTRFYFENNQPQEGLASYAKLKDFVHANITRESTLTNINNLENYYNAYALFLNGDVAKAEQILINIQEKSEAEKLLLGKILLKQQQYSEAIDLLKQLDTENAFYQYWLAKTYQMDNQMEAYQNQISKIKTLIEIDDLDYALIARFL